MVTKFQQPDFTGQDATTYKSSIDNSIAMLAQLAKQFAPREMATPALGITIEEGILSDGTHIAAQNVAGIGAPSASPRIDRIYYDMNLRSFQRVVGAEASSPVAPSLPFGAIPIAQIYLTVGMTAIRNADIMDDRSFMLAPVAFLAGDGYTSIVGADGLLRVIIGKGGVDHRIIFRLHNDSDAKIQIQNSSGATVAELDASGNIKIAGTLTQNATF